MAARVLIWILLLTLTLSQGGLVELGTRPHLPAFSPDGAHGVILAQSSKQSGISFAAWWPGFYSHPDADLALANLADTGADWIALIVTQYQDDIASTAIYPTAATPADVDLIHVIAEAHRLGLKVMLKPHVDLANDPDPNQWRGMIGEGFSEAEWNAWFSSYQNFINHYAGLAQTYGADQFCVGTELSASQGRDSDWRAVIANVRGIYTGPLTYAANHDATDVPWWDAVDLIGVDAYYKLTDKNTPTIAELEAAWEPHVEQLAVLAATWNKPIIFTEIGYRSLDGANRYPWDWQIQGTVDLQEQADAYQAVFESVFDQPWFGGMYWWAWETDPFQGGPCDDGYAPYDKPAEDVLRTWYGGPPRNRASPPEPDYSRTLEIFTDGLGAGWDDWSWDATVDFLSTDPVTGTYAISVAAQAWGALSLHHAAVDTGPYYWLEFYVRKSSADQQLHVFAHDDHDQELRERPVDDCRYTDQEPIQPDIWTRVRIPLDHLDAVQRRIERVSIRNHNDYSSSFWVDEMRLVGATWHVYLPVLLRNSAEGG